VVRDWNDSEFGKLRKPAIVKRGSRVL
jgi:hypothetical protein